MYEQREATQAFLQVQAQVEKAALTHCNSLQLTANHCNSLPHTATHCTHCDTLQHTATHCNADVFFDAVTRSAGRRRQSSADTLQLTATHCNSLQRTATHRHTMQFTAPTATHCNADVFFDVVTRSAGRRRKGSADALQLTATHCKSLHLAAAHCHTLQHTAKHCNTLQHNYIFWCHHAKCRQTQTKQR